MFWPQGDLWQILPEIIRSYALDALDSPGEMGNGLSAESGKAFLKGICGAPGKSYSSIGLGENIRFEDLSVSGAALIHEGGVLHLSAFSHNVHKNDDLKTVRRET